MKKENIALEILKILGIYLAGCLLWLLVFSTFMPADETGATTEPFQGAICVFGVITATIVVFVVNYNLMQKAFQKTKSAFSNIKVFKDRTERLLEKANKVADKYMANEENIQIGVAEKRTKKTKLIRNAQQCFPNNILSKIFRFKDVEFYSDEEENEITDEELGI